MDGLSVAIPEIFNKQTPGGIEDLWDPKPNEGMHSKEAPSSTDISLVGRGSSLNIN